MRYSEENIGKVFVLRLDDGDRIPESVESFAQNKGVSHIVETTGSSARRMLDPATGFEMLEP